MRRPRSDQFRHPGYLIGVNQHDQRPAACLYRTSHQVHQPGISASHVDQGKAGVSGQIPPLGPFAAAHRNRFPSEMRRTFRQPVAIVPRKNEERTLFRGRIAAIYPVGLRRFQDYSDPLNGCRFSAAKVIMPLPRSIGCPRLREALPCLSY